jgi:NADH-quinone oxidoreductase subunit H
MQVRHGPQPHRPAGLLQPIADALKLLTKEIIQPTAASKGLFLLGPGHDHHAGAGGLGGDSVRPDVALANINAGCCS